MWWCWCYNRVPCTWLLASDGVTIIVGKRERRECRHAIADLKPAEPLSQILFLYRPILNIVLYRPILWFSEKRWWTVWQLVEERRGQCRPIPKALLSLWAKSLLSRVKSFFASAHLVTSLFVVRPSPTLFLLPIKVRTTLLSHPHHNLVIWSNVRARHCHWTEKLFKDVKQKRAHTWLSTVPSLLNLLGFSQSQSSLTTWQTIWHWTDKQIEYAKQATLKGFEYLYICRISHKLFSHL